MTTKTERRCDKCEYFSHALAAMTDHVDYHTCIFFDKPLPSVFEARTCKTYKRESK